MLKLRAVLALGIPNILRVVMYRLSIRLGISSVQRLRAIIPAAPFFTYTEFQQPIDAPPVNAWQLSTLLFGHFPFPVSNQPPNWLANPFTGKVIPGADQAWWQIADFDESVGDIKLIWELSRMDWVVAFSQRARQGQQTELRRLNNWLADWCNSNPHYQGPNWKCGQEASIRVIHLAIAADFLDQVTSPCSGLRDLVLVHLRRIAPTISYAIAQDNNHATSEAAALFIGGSWMAMLGVPEGQKWQQTGRRYLERCASRLIGTDGGFSQYSINYHRFTLDTLCVAEVWRRKFNLPVFSSQFESRALAATQWLRHMISSANGDVPNIGANDGAWLLQLADTAYRDYRPTVQLASVLFARKRAIDAEGSWNNVLKWFGLEMPGELLPEPGNYLENETGFAVLRRANVFVAIRYPRFRFRPSQADALHLDFWLFGENILRDAGSFSYNTDHHLMQYFSGTASHNTVQFDDHDQMPKVSRFLFADWLITTDMEPVIDDGETTRFMTGYRDRIGISHRRNVAIADGILNVVDKIERFQKKAVLRWRLAPGDWSVEMQDNVVRLHRDDSSNISMTVECTGNICRYGLAEGFESLHYMEMTQVPVLEIEVDADCTLDTNLRWNHV